ncbi:MAG: hypothetical protein FWC97_06760 [Treponema sp.]|nr:hypothetical protein [Treponema sp.]
MKNAQKIIGLILFLFIGISVAAAQDLIVMRNGNIIEARVTEISSAEIRYRRIDFLDGPVFVISAANVHSIRFENGTHQVFNQAPPAGQPQAQTARAVDTAIDPDRFVFGFNLNAGGLIASGLGGGASLNFDLGRGNFNSSINLIFPTLGGFGGLATFNYFWHTRLGGGFLGGGLVFVLNDWSDHFAIGLNGGYRFVTRVGVYFNAGIFLGYDFLGENPIYFLPNLSVGWTMR